MWRRRMYAAYDNFVSEIEEEDNYEECRPEQGASSTSTITSDSDDDFQLVSEVEQEESDKERLVSEVEKEESDKESQPESEDEEVQTTDESDKESQPESEEQEVQTTDADGGKLVANGLTYYQFIPVKDLEESDKESQPESEDEEVQEESDRESQPGLKDQEVQTTDAAELAVNGNHSAPTIATLTLSDSDVFDCTICSEPLTIPVYQCENGHFSCWSCCDMVDICPCSGSLGFTRCQGMDKVLQSIKISCPNMEHGCTEETSYYEKLEHENSCQYTPTQCPYPSCDYISGRRNLYMHYAKLHTGSCRIITFNEANRVRMGVDEELLLLFGCKTDYPFFLNRVIGPLGSFVNVSTAVDMKFSYELIATVGDKSVTVKNTVEVTQKDFEKPAMENCVLITPDFYEGLDNNGDNSLRLQVVIYEASW